VQGISRLTEELLAFQEGLGCFEVGSCMLLEKELTVVLLVLFYLFIYLFFFYLVMSKYISYLLISMYFSMFHFVWFRFYHLCQDIKCR